MTEPLNEPLTARDQRYLDSLRKIQFAPPEAKRYIVDRVAEEITLPASRVSGLGNVMPWLIDIDPFLTATNTNWDTIDTAGATYANHYRGGVKHSTGAQNAEISWAVVLAAGTWTIEILHWRDTDNGIYSVQIDGVEKGTVEGYAAAPAANIRSTVTGIVIPTSAKYTLKLKMATKNASSTNYRGRITAVQLRRTA